MSFEKMMQAGALFSSIGLVTSGFATTTQIELREPPPIQQKNHSMLILQQTPYRIRSATPIATEKLASNESTTDVISREMTNQGENLERLRQHISARFVAEPLLQGKKGNSAGKNTTVSISSTEPTADISPSFSNPVTDAAYTSSYGMRGGRHHNGLDIVSMSKTLDIRAAKTGVVVVSQLQSNGLGNLIVLDHGDGLESYYAHLSKRYAKEGDIVRAGDIIGKMGSTGQSTGVHLHFEIRKDNKPMNPFAYIQ